MKKLLIAGLVVMMLIAAVGCANTDTAPVATDVVDGETDVTETGDAVVDAANAYFANIEGNNIIAWADLFTLMDAGEAPFILSIRQADVYGEGHIEGAYLAAWGTDLAEKVAMLPTDETVYVYCYSGQTAGQAVALMNMLGIDAVSLKSGYNFGATATEGYEAYVSTEAAELPDAGAEFDADVLAYVQNYFNTVADNANFITAAADAKTLIEAGEMTVVDIRTADDYAAGHIEGAISLPYGAGMDFSGLSMDDKLLVACYSGQTAGQTVAIMKALGYDAVSLKSGMNGWVADVKTTVANAYFADFPGSRIVTWEDLFAKMDAGDEPFILSIRQQDVYDEGHITGAALAAWGEDLASKVSMLPTDETVYVYCYSGQTAGQTVALLNMLGIEAVSVKSGYDFGATKVEGYEAYVSTEAVELADAGASFDVFMLAEVEAYFAAATDNANYKIGWDDTQAAVEAGEATVIDIRTAEDFAAGHIVGAINIPWGADMQESFTDLPAGKLIIACYSGQTAGQATAVLRMLGKDAVSLHFGMSVGWIAEGYPVVVD